MTNRASADTTPPRRGAGRRRVLVPLTWLREHAFLAYVWSVVLVGAALTAAMAVGSRDAHVGGWAAAIMAGLFLGADRPLLDVRFGHNSESFTWAELCVVVGLFLLPTPPLVLIAAVCVLLFHLLMRRAPVKAAFNAACFAIGVALAGLTAYLVGGAHDVLDVRRAVGLVAAGVMFHVWNGTAVARVVALSAGIPFREVYYKVETLCGLVAAGNIAAGVSVLALFQWSQPTVLVLPPLLLMMYTAYRGYLHAMQERDVWQQLERAARQLNQLDEVAVARAAVEHAAQMLKADVVEITIDDGNGARSYVGGADGLSVDVTTAPLGAQAEQPVLLYGAPLEGPHGRIGMLRVGFNGHVSLTKREQQVLKTFAHAVSTTLQNARLYTEMREHADAKAYEASHDSLTGLGNRSLLHDRAALALAAASSVGTQVALLIIDLDHFKEINDTLGHNAGDVFLQQVGTRITTALPHAEAVCRLGGDEYAVLLGNLPDVEAADRTAEQLLEVLAEPVVFDGLRLSVEGSVGVACYPADAATFEELLQRADVALYQAKDSRGSFSHYRAERDVSSVQRLALAAELRSALSNDELVVHFQPQYDLQSGAIVGAECLVRWQHPHRGLLQPGEFVSAVEHSGLVRDFTLAVLEKGVAECARWSRAGRHLTIAVNLSARNLLDRQLPLDVASVLSRHALSPQQLVLEITETTMMSELDVVETVLAQLRALGVQLSVDDFGTGYSSLAFLQRVQVNEVKIDRMFVAGVSTSENDRALVRATVQLAHSLGARCVGEGVETREQFDVLASLGCDLAQGYHLCRPVPASAVRAEIGLTVEGVPMPRTETDTRHLRAVEG